MNLLFDTNIILYLIRDKSSGEQLEKFLNPSGKSIFISLVSVAELYSIAFQNQWKEPQRQKLEAFLENVQIIMVDDFLTRLYVEIDAFSQRKHPGFQNYAFSTPRNMGKNDLWIAATTSLLQLRLMTTDFDFDHLESHFLSVQRIDTDLIKAIINQS